MGLGRTVVEVLIQENKHRPLDGDAVLIGRQSVSLTPEETLSVFQQLDADTGAFRPEDIRDFKTREAECSARPLTSDVALLQILGARSIKALDHSAYEGAEIIHDLNEPLPQELHGIADLVIDGSTLDNVFNPALALKTFAELLRPGGRLVCSNTYSNTGFPYTILTPLWFLDYFVSNGFADCKVYVTVDMPGGENVFTINLYDLKEPHCKVSAFTSANNMGVIVFAEKGPHSTTDRMPSQQHYRSDAQWVSYRENLKAILNGRHPHVARSRCPIEFFAVSGGHMFMGDDFTARDPQTEINKLIPRAAAPLLDRPAAL